MIGYNVIMFIIIAIELISALSYLYKRKYSSSYTQFAMFALLILFMWLINRG